jgi:hypothetical protein
VKADRRGNDGPWTRWKTKDGFPTAPTALGNRKRRDSHISTAATRRGKVENEKHVSHFPARCLCVFQTTQKGGLAPGRSAPAFRLILQLENADRSCG